jgi:hypothetical protein
MNVLRALTSPPPPTLMLPAGVRRSHGQSTLDGIADRRDLLLIQRLAMETSSLTEAPFPLESTGLQWIFLRNQSLVYSGFAVQALTGISSILAGFQPLRPELPPITLVIKSA